MYPCFMKLGIVVLGAKVNKTERKPTEGKKEMHNVKLKKKTSPDDQRALKEEESRERRNRAGRKETINAILWKGRTRTCREKRRKT